MSISSPVQRPVSATHPAVAWAGFAVLIATFAYFAHHQIPGYFASIVAVAAVALATIAVDIVFFKAHRRPTTGLDWSRRDLNLERVLIKLLGLALTLGLIWGAYTVFAEYKSDLYKPFWQAVDLLLPGLIVFAVLYIVVVDMVMINPKDSYYNFGLLALGRFSEVNKAQIVPYIRSWLIKGFFVPLMFAFTAGNMGQLYDVWHGNWPNEFIAFYTAVVLLIYTVDVVFAVAGYVFAFRVLDTHERSTEPTMTGWVVALMCYQPFYYMFDKSYLGYEDNITWQNFFVGHEGIGIIWAAIIIVLLGIYTWATVVFGLRFSNLTHRGIITNGPYRFTKHPAYLAKNISWWMITIPFISIVGPGQAAINCVLLLAMNGVYIARAWTEERHLMDDPVYRDYQAYIAAHGLFRWLKFPWPRHAVKDV